MTTREAVTHKLYLATPGQGCMRNGVQQNETIQRLSMARDQPSGRGDG